MAAATPVRRRKNNNRRQEILDAAQELFFEKGYRATTVEQVASRAGYSKRAVYLDFLNKDDLYITVGARGLELLIERLSEIPEDGITVEEFLFRFLDVLTKFSREHGKYLQMYFAESTPEIIANCSPKVREHVEGLEFRGLSLVVRQVERAVEQKILPPMDCWETAGIFIGSVTGVILLSMVGNQTMFSRQKLETMSKKAAWLIWNGLSTWK
ncbi:MAG: TetR/AcrR family transcriptional regulator [Desulfatibacillaceae bacterium]